VKDRLAEQTACLRPYGRLSSAVGSSDLPALYAHRAALFSVHRKVRASRHRRTIATRGPRAKRLPAAQYDAPTEKWRRFAADLTPPPASSNGSLWSGSCPGPGQMPATCRSALFELGGAPRYSMPKTPAIGRGMGPGQATQGPLTHYHALAP